MLPPSSPQTALKELHLWDYVGVVLNRLHVFLTVFIGILLLVGLYTLTRTPLYRATARILIESKGIDITNTEGSETMGGTSYQDREYLPTQLMLITSRPVLERVLEHDDLISHPDFAEGGDPIARLSGAIMVGQIHGSRLVDVSVDRERPEDAARIANALVESYQQFERMRRLGISEGGLVELHKKSEELREKISDINKELKKFLLRHNIVSFEHSRSMVESRSAGLNESLWHTEPLRIQIKSKVETVKLGEEGDALFESVPEVYDSPVIIALIQTLADLERQEADLKHRYGKEHPQLRGIAVQAVAIKNNMERYARSVLRSMHAQYEILNKEVGYLREAMRAQEMEVSRFGELSEEYGLLTLEEEFTKESYRLVNRRIEEISLNSLSGQGDNIFIISPAEVPRVKSFPKTKMNLLLGGMLALFFAVGSCIFLDYMDTSLKTVEDVQQTFDAEILGVIPSGAPELGPGDHLDLLALTKPKSHFAEAFRMLRAAIFLGSTDRRMQVLAITSTMPQEGKSLSSINLAVANAFSNKRTLLIDADMRRPRLHDAFNQSMSRGLSTLLAEGVTSEGISQAVIDLPEDPNLFLMPAGEIPTNPSSLLEGPAFKQLIDTLRSSYDVIIIDTPPLLSLVDSSLIAQRSDGIIMVVRAFSTQRKAAVSAAANLSATNTRLLGCVVNNADFARTNRLYGYMSYKYYGAYFNDADSTGPKKKKKG